MKLRASLPLFVTALSFQLLLAGCGRKHGAPAVEHLPVARVRTQTIEKKTRTAMEEAVGTVRAKLHAAIEAKVSGRIEKMLAVPGRSVKSGELVVQLDDREIKARQDQALAVREQAENDLRRFTTLFKSQTITQAEFDNVQARARVARAAAEEAQTMLAHTALTAPFDGVVTRKYADVGDLAAPGKTLLELEDASSLRLEADVPEAAIGTITLGAKLPVRVASLTNDMAGVVAEIAPAADPVSRTSLVKLDLPTVPGLRAGLFGRVSVPVGETTALRVPAAAVLRRGQMELVFVVVNQRAQLRLVKTGRRIGDEVELVSGVDAGEQVVVEGAADLTDGQPVVAK